MKQFINAIELGKKLYPEMKEPYVDKTIGIVYKMLGF